MPSLLLNYIMVVLRYSIDYQDPGFILDWYSIAIQYKVSPDSERHHKASGKIEI
jgi:hypothetical protein